MTATNGSKEKPKQKALLRGVSHQFAAVAAAAAGTLLTLDSPTPKARLGCLIYSFTLVAMFTISAAYHIPHWGPVGRSRMRKLDHAGIYGIIAGTYTPLCLLALDTATGHRLLWQVWIGAAAGIAHCLIAKGGSFHKLLSAFLYVALGWVAFPYTGQMKAAMGLWATNLVILGGVSYTIGALIYAARWPDPAPTTFGYHELFHAAVIVASIMHFGAVRSVVGELKNSMCTA